MHSIMLDEDMHGVASLLAYLMVGLIIIIIITRNAKHVPRPA